MPASQVKLFGERNTGTNALQQLIEMNSSATCLPGTTSELNSLAARLGRSEWIPDARWKERIRDVAFQGTGARYAWKHCATNFADAADLDGVLVLFTVRHPASWLVSLFRNPYHHHGKRAKSPEELLHLEWRTVGRERIDGRAFRPLDLLAAKLDSYDQLSANLAERGTAHRFLRFEDLILRQRDVFDRIKLDLSCPRADFVELEESTKDPTKSLDQYRDYYGNERWLDDLKGIEAELDSQVEWEKWRRFGYAPITNEGPPRQVGA
jgi:hypothetical protein